MTSTSDKLVALNALRPYTVDHGTMKRFPMARLGDFQVRSDGERQSLTNQWDTLTHMEDIAKPEADVDKLRRLSEVVKSNHKAIQDLDEDMAKTTHAMAQSVSERLTKATEDWRRYDELCAERGSDVIDSWLAELHEVGSRFETRKMSNLWYFYCR